MVLHNETRVTNLKKSREAVILDLDYTGRVVLMEW